MKKKPIPVTVVCSEPPPKEFTNYQLAQVLCLYKQGNETEISMLHSVGPDHRLGPGQPVDPKEFARSIYRLQRDEMIERLTLFGENVLAENHDAICWWRPASPAAMYFKTAEPEPRLTALNGVPLPQPPLVFLASKRANSLCVWALRDNERPSAKTPLYHAPYMNMSPAPHVCLGNAINQQRENPTEWERVFFGSNGSHTPPHIRYGKEKKTTTEQTAREASLARYISFLEKLRQFPPESCSPTHWIGSCIGFLYSQALVSDNITLAGALKSTRI
jgi:PRTRC genetic system protein B